MSKLKPCPFCGEEARLMIRNPHEENYYFIECQGDFNCAGGMMDECAYGTREEAIAAWNQRGRIKMTEQNDEKYEGSVHRPFSIRISDDYVRKLESQLSTTKQELERIKEQLAGFVLATRQVELLTPPYQDESGIMEVPLHVYGGLIRTLNAYKEGSDE